MIISVASGKGGTGKTTVAVNLALILAEDHEVELMDADVEAPNAHLFVRPTIEEQIDATIPVPQVDEGKCTYCGKCSEACAFNALAVSDGLIMVFAELCHGCGGCSFVCPEGAITETPRPVGIVEWGYAKEFGHDFIHGKLDPGEALAPPITKEIKRHLRGREITIIDAPPGTSCTAVEAVKDSDYCILVTEPTPFGLRDLDLTVKMLNKLDLQMGVVINRSDMGDEAVREYCRSKGIPIIAELPFDRAVATAYANGEPVARVPGWRSRFETIADTVLKEVAVKEGA